MSKKESYQPKLVKKKAINQMSKKESYQPNE